MTAILSHGESEAMTDSTAQDIAAVLSGIILFAIVAAIVFFHIY